VSVYRSTVYTSLADKANGAARRLFQSPRGRFGTVGIEDSPELRKAAIEFGEANFAVVDFSGASDAPGSQGWLFPPGTEHWEQK